jgi:hypothetical protein
VIPPPPSHSWRSVGGPRVPFTSLGPLTATISSPLYFLFVGVIPGALAVMAPTVQGSNNQLGARFLVVNSCRNNSVRPVNAITHDQLEFQMRRVISASAYWIFSTVTL